MIIYKRSGVNVDISLLIYELNTLQAKCTPKQDLTQVMGKDVQYFI